MRKLSTMGSEEMDVFKIVLLGDVGVGKTGPFSEEDSIGGAVTETTHKRLRLQTLKEQWIYA